MFFECDERILVIDCGLMFPTEDMPGVDLVLPDLRYLEDRAACIDGVLLTHGHEDHIGAVPYLLNTVSADVYGTALCLGILKRKLEEAGVLGHANLIEVDDGGTVEIGPFRVQAIPVTHSTPQSLGLAIDTPQGRVVHTGDFKLDPTPVDGRITDLSTFGALGKEGVRLLLSDSTNSEHAQPTRSETEVGDWLADIFARQAERRIIAACFASHLHRVQQIVDVATDDGRSIAFLGRSMHSNTELASKMGVLDLSAADIVDITEIADLDPESACVICTGSQGEPFAALSLMAGGDNKFIDVGEDDAVIISSTPIPGNEAKIHRSINGLARAGAEVIHSEVAQVHASGHASATELKVMLTLVRPENFLPVHGEYRHLAAHARIARSVGLDADSVFVAEDGDVIELMDDGIEFADTQVESGYLYVDGAGIGDITKAVLRHRRGLADDGVLVCVVGVDSHTGDVVRGPEIFSRGFVTTDEHEKFANEAAERVVASIEDAAADNHLDLTTLNRHVREALGGIARRKTGRSPFVFPIVIEV